MNPLPYILAPMLLLPAVAAPLPERKGEASVSVGDRSGAALGDIRIEADDSLSALLSLPYRTLVPDAQSDPAQQVRIEQSVTVRVVPRSAGRVDPRIAAPDVYPARHSRPRLEERKMAKCVPVQGVAGVQISPGNKLVLYLHDSRIVSAGLDKGCNARDFYSGFYVARSPDGLMCSGRDKLQARNGASCKLGKMKQIVVAGD